MSTLDFKKVRIKIPIVRDLKMRKRQKRVGIEKKEKKRERGK